jgi:hypothetical protein
MNEEENWLHGEQIECPSCHQLLYRVDHSPFYDEHFLYCDRCPIRVEVSYYDPVYTHVYKDVRQTHTQPQEDEYRVLMRAVEARLKPCRCGGRFLHDASRRCLTCSTPVITENTSGIDLFRWHDTLLPDSTGLTDEALQEEEERWRSQFLRTEDIWRDDLR